LDHMIKMGDAFRSISVQHPQDLDTHEVMAASAKQDHLLAQFMALTTTLGERTQAWPKHSINAISYSSSDPQHSLLNTQAGPLSTTPSPPVRSSTLNQTNQPAPIPTCLATWTRSLLWPPPHAPLRVRPPTR
jgi:hypothetical protein